MDDYGNMDDVERTTAFLRDRFSSFYKREKPFLPPRFGSREWAFFLWEGRGMLRHTGFVKRDKLLNFLQVKGPRHVYYSSAYYRRPAAQNMGDKGWLGADLIFDLDADHIEGYEKMSYKEMLERVKEELIKLVHEFILGDLAFDIDDVSLVFSGGRGYHVHVRDPRVFELDSHERKEIVDYIMATDLDWEDLIREEVFAVDESSRYSKAYKRRVLAKKGSGGWKERLRNGIKTYLRELKEKDEEEVLEEFEKGEGVGEKTARKIYEKLFVINDPEDLIRKMDQENTLEFFPEKRTMGAFLKLVVEQNKVFAAEADAPVTRDIHRLIRLPGSLHGKSTLRVLPLEADEIKDFEPLRDAVVFGEDPVRIDVKEKVVFEIGDEEFELDRGETELPEYAAMFLMARGGAFKAGGG